MAQNDLEQKGIKRGNEEKEEERLPKRPSTADQSKGFKQGSEQKEDERLAKRPSTSDQSKGNKQGSEQKEDERPAKRPSTSDQRGKENLKILIEKHDPFCKEITKYEKFEKIGQGTFGEVYKVSDKTTGKHVALKKILMENEKEGFPITALREIKILQLLKHENIVNLIEIGRTKYTKHCKSTFYLVFEYCEHDLAGVLGNAKIQFSLGEIKMVMKQLLNGLYFIHSNKVLHRDLKAPNILITKSGTLKIADFGLARAYSDIKSADKPNRYTNRVVTLWYRPPELLLGERNYGPAVDLWGAGCIMAEMWSRIPLMQGATEQQQLTLISKLCGSITPESFPGCEKLDLYGKLELPKGEKRKVKRTLKAYVTDQHALDLFDRFLLLDPVKRIGSDEALDHDFFWSDPLPSDLSKVLLPHTGSMNVYSLLQKQNSVKHKQPHPTANDGEYFDRVF